MTRGRATSFREVMEGSLSLVGESAARPLRLELAVEAPSGLRLWTTSHATVSGRVRSPGWADDPAASGDLEISPVERRRIRYRLSFTTANGRRLRLDGWKTTALRHPVRSMTELPATVTDESGAMVGQAALRFDLRRDLGVFLASFQRGTPPGPDRYLASRWRGQRGRLEVWYTTLTDPATGTGVWLHHELVVPTAGHPAYADAPRAHGWAAVFPPDGPPIMERFGPEPWVRPTGGAAFDAAGARVEPARIHGATRGLAWDLAVQGGGPPLFTFPRWAWERELLPAAQIVPAPAAAFTGRVRAGERTIVLDGAPGATGRIYGHGNARRWAWLHADLGGGDVLELVAAVSTRPGLRALPPLPFLRLRLNGTDWPSRPLLTALRLRSHIGLPSWWVYGQVGGRRIHVEVVQPPEATVAVDYADPDGAPAVCRNTERASAVVTLQRRTGNGWQIERRWKLTGTAHAEVGSREPDATGGGPP